MRAIVDVAGGGFIGSTIHSCSPSVPEVTICPGHTADPTGTRSAREALQACINGNPNGTLALPPGNYLIDGDERPGQVGGTPRPAGITIAQPITITTQGTAGQDSCLSPTSFPSVRCARFLGAFGLLHEGGIVKITSSNVTLDHIILDGNRSGRVRSEAWNRCAAGPDFDPQKFNRWGFNGQVDHVDHVTFTNSASVNAVCGTGFEWFGNSAIIKFNNFIGNGDHGIPNDSSTFFLWADGLTLMQSDDAFVENNRFIDGSDIGFIVGGAQRASIQNNVITQLGATAFAGFMMDNFTDGDTLQNKTTGNFENTIIAHNIVTCSPFDNCSYAVNIGDHPWVAGAPSITGGTFRDNIVSGGFAALNVDGATGISIHDNSLSTDADHPGCLAPSRYNVAPGSQVIPDDASAGITSRVSTGGCH